MEDRLRSRPECAALFGGLDKALSLLANTSYSYAEIPNGHAHLDNGVPVVTGAATINPTTVWINNWGPFLDQDLAVPGLAQGVHFDFGTGLKDGDFGALILLHELGHQAGIFGEDAQNLGENQAHTQQVYEACFK